MSSTWTPPTGAYNAAVDMIDRHLQEGRGDKLALVDPRTRLTYSELAAPVLAREDGDQAAVTGIEVEMAHRMIVEVRLLEYERHAEHALPEVDRALAVGAHECDVVHARGRDDGRHGLLLLRHQYVSTW